MSVKIEPSWKALLHQEFEQPYFTELISFVRQEYQTHTVYPAGGRIFAAFDACPVQQVKVVILGQDPYHGPGQANGLCFSVNPGVQVPPSLHNIYQEIEQDLKLSVNYNSGDLSSWASQGVLLLNATLTVRQAEAGSHQGKGWEKFTDAVIQSVAALDQPIVFLLWGNYARRKAPLVQHPKHLVLEAPHPSPLSAHRGFLGCKHFSQCNNWLLAHGVPPIKWA